MSLQVLLDQAVEEIVQDVTVNLTSAMGELVVETEGKFAERLNNLEDFIDDMIIGASNSIVEGFDLVEEQMRLQVVLLYVVVGMLGFMVLLTGPIALLFWTDFFCPRKD